MAICCVLPGDTHVKSCATAPAAWRYSPRSAAPCRGVSPTSYAASGADCIGVGVRRSSLEAASNQTWPSCRKDMRTSSTCASRFGHRPIFGGRLHGKMRLPSAQFLCRFRIAPAFCVYLASGVVEVVLWSGTAVAAGFQQLLPTMR